MENALGATFGLESGLWSFFFLLIVGFLATEPWRYLGIILASPLNADSEILKWIQAVSVSLLAGLVIRMLLFPAGALSEAPLWLRLFSFSLGLCVFFIMKRNFIMAVLSTSFTLIGLQFLLF